jgi:hypothetical protein
VSGSLAGEAAPPVRQPLRKLVIDLIAYRTAPLLPVGVFPFRYLLAETFNLLIGPGLRPRGQACPYPTSIHSTSAQTPFCIAMPSCFLVGDCAAGVFSSARRDF